MPTETFINRLAATLRSKSQQPKTSHPLKQMTPRLIKAPFIGVIALVLQMAFLANPALAQSTDNPTTTPKKAQIIDRAYFFKRFRSQFHPIREKEQYLIGRYETIFNYWDSEPKLTDLRWLAYILATTYHETGRKIKAVRECFGKTDAASIACVTRLYRRGRIKRNYARIDPKTGKSYFGRGHVQLTWDYNYKRMGKELGMKNQIYINPDLALDKDTSVAILAQGMIKGLFTGKRLSKYFNASSTNWGGARRIVNGMDKYKLIGGYGRKFHATLRTIPSGAPVADACEAANVPQSCLNKLNSKLAVLDTKFNELNTTYKTTLNDNLALQTRVKEQAEEIEQLKTQLNPEETPETTDKLAALEKKLQDLEGRISTLTAENTKTKADNTRLATLAEELQNKLDDTLTTGSTTPDADLIKQRLEEIEADHKTLKQQLADVKAQQQKLDSLNSSLTRKETKLNAQIQDIELSRQALQTRETNFLKDQAALDVKERSLSSKDHQLNVKEARLKRFAKDLETEKQILADLKSKPWYTRMWDSVSSTWRKE